MTRMSSTLGTGAASFVVGVVLSLVGVLGGVSAISPSPNSAEASESVVLYDAR